MRSFLSALVFTAAVALTGGCAHRIPDLPPVPTAVTQTADQDVHAAAAKAYGILISLDELVNTISRVEDDASHHGLPASADAEMDRVFLSYVAASRTAGDALAVGLDSWDALKAALDPVRQQAQRLIDEANMVLATKAEFTNLISTLGALLQHLWAATSAPVRGGLQ